MSRPLVAAVVCLAACGVSQETHRDVVNQLAEARAQLDRERAQCQAASAKKPEEPPKTPETPEPPEPTFSQATPKDALNSFIAAYKAERWDVMIRFVPDRYLKDVSADKIRKQLEESEEVKRNIELIEAAVSSNAEIEVNGDKAEMDYGDGKEVELILEGGVWKIDDLD